MKQFYTAVLERKNSYDHDFATEPYESAWASEAIFFLQIEAVKGKNPVITSRVQISPDGINWIDEGSAFPPAKEEGHYFVKVAHFGGWLRLINEIAGDEAQFNVTIHLVLKE